MQSPVVYSLNHDTTMNVIRALTYPNFTKFCLHLHRYQSVRVHPYAHSLYMEVHKHFICIHIWVWKAVSSGLHHQPSIMTSQCHLVSTYPKFPKVDPNLLKYDSVRVHPYAHPQHMRVHKLNHDTSVIWAMPYPIFLDFDPNTGIKQYKGAPICPLISYKTLYIHPKWMGCSQLWFLASPWNHKVILAPNHPNYPKYDPIL